MLSTSKVYSRLFGRQVGWQTKHGSVGFKIFKIFYMLNYLNFYFANITAMLLIVLEVYFSQLVSNEVYFKASFEVRKIWFSFVHVDPYC